MTDRELLELAAKAAGVSGDEWVFGEGRSGAIRNGLWDDLNETEWNPLTDDGDALRLAVNLRLTVKVVPHEIEVFDEEGCLVSVGMDESCDYQADTRRAIVRAAAEIGKAM